MPTSQDISALNTTVTALQTRSAAVAAVTLSPITKTTLGLQNVENTADLNKVMSTPTQTYVDGKITDTEAFATAADVTNLNAAKAYTDANAVSPTDLTTLSDNIALTYATITALNTLTTTVSTNDTTLRNDMADDILTGVNSAKAYADSLSLGTTSLRGAFDPTGASMVPTTGGRGAAGAITKGDLWVISTTGVGSPPLTLSISAVDIGIVTPGDFIMALIDDPLVAADWGLIETPNSFAAIPAGMIAVVIDGSNSTSTDYVASVKAVVDYVTGNFTTITWGNSLAAIVTDIATAVNNQAAAIEELQNAVLNSG